MSAVRGGSVRGRVCTELSGAGLRSRALISWVLAVLMCMGLSGLVAPSASAAASALSFQPMAPVRLLDTRSGLGAAKAPVAAKGTVTLQVTGRGGVPAGGVGAVVLTITALAPTAG